MQEKHFDKYEISGAYHWDQATRSITNAQYNPLLEGRYEGLLKIAPDEAKKVLEIGCGDAYFTYLMKMKYPDADVFGIDLNMNGIRAGRLKLRERNAQVFLSLASVNEFSFSDNTFDLIIMADVIEHLAEPEKAIKEVNRVD